MRFKDPLELFLWNCAVLLDAKYGRFARLGNYVRYNGKDEIWFRVTLNNRNADPVGARIPEKLGELGYSVVTHTYQREGNTSRFYAKFSKV